MLSCWVTENLVDRLLGRFDGGRTQAYTHTLLDTDRSDIWSPSVCLHHAPQMGHGRLDDLLHPCNSCLLVLPPVVLVLEDGRFLMGSDAYCHG